MNTNSECPRYFLPSEIARLVLGYLKEENYLKTYRCFLKECDHLREYEALLRQGQEYPTSIMGLTLMMMLHEYAQLKLNAVHAEHRSVAVSSLWNQLEAVVSHLKKRTGSCQFRMAGGETQSVRTTRLLKQARGQTTHTGFSSGAVTLPEISSSSVPAVSSSSAFIRLVGRNSNPASEFMSALGAGRGVLPEDGHDGTGESEETHQTELILADRYQSCGSNAGIEPTGCRPSFAVNTAVDGMNRLGPAVSASILIPGNPTITVSRTTASSTCIASTIGASVVSSSISITDAPISNVCCTSTSGVFGAHDVLTSGESSVTRTSLTTLVHSAPTAALSSDKSYTSVNSQVCMTRTEETRNREALLVLSPETCSDRQKMSSDSTSIRSEMSETSSVVAGSSPCLPLMPLDLCGEVIPHAHSDTFVVNSANAAELLGPHQSSLGLCSDELCAPENGCRNMSVTGDERRGQEDQESAAPKRKDFSVGNSNMQMAAKSPASPFQKLATGQKLVRSSETELTSRSLHIEESSRSRPSFEALQHHENMVAAPSLRSALDLQVCAGSHARQESLGEEGEKSCRDVAEENVDIGTNDVDIQSSNAMGCRNISSGPGDEACSEDSIMLSGHLQTSAGETCDRLRERSPKRKKKPPRRRTDPLVTVNDSQWTGVTGACENHAGNHALDSIINNPQIAERLADNINRSLYSESHGLHHQVEAEGTTHSSEEREVPAPESGSRENSLEEILNTSHKNMSEEAVSEIIRVTRNDPVFQSLFKLFNTDREEYIEREFGTRHTCGSVQTGQLQKSSMSVAQTSRQSQMELDGSSSIPTTHRVLPSHVCPQHQLEQLNSEVGTRNQLGEQVRLEIPQNQQELMGSEVNPKTCQGQIGSEPSPPYQQNEQVRSEVRGDEGYRELVMVRSPQTNQVDHCGPKDSASAVPGTENVPGQTRKLCHSTTEPDKVLCQSASQQGSVVCQSTSEQDKVLCQSTSEQGMCKDIISPEKNTDEISGGLEAGPSTVKDASDVRCTDTVMSPSNSCESSVKKDASFSGHDDDSCMPVEQQTGVALPLCHGTEETMEAAAASRIREAGMSSVGDSQKRQGDVKSRMQMSQDVWSSPAKSVIAPEQFACVLMHSNSASCLHSPSSSGHQAANGYHASAGYCSRGVACCPSSSGMKANLKSTTGNDKSQKCKPCQQRPASVLAASPKVVSDAQNVLSHGEHCIAGSSQHDSLDGHESSGTLGLLRLKKALQTNHLQQELQAARTPEQRADQSKSLRAHSLAAGAHSSHASPLARQCSSAHKTARQQPSCSSSQVTLEGLQSVHSSPVLDRCKQASKCLVSSDGDSTDEERKDISCGASCNEHAGTARDAISLGTGTPHFDSTFQHNPVSSMQNEGMPPQHSFSNPLACFASESLPENESLKEVHCCSHQSVPSASCSVGECSVATGSVEKAVDGGRDSDQWQQPNAEQISVLPSTHDKLCNSEKSPAPEASKSLQGGGLSVRHVSEESSKTELTLPLLPIAVQQYLAQQIECGELEIPADLTNEFASPQKLQPCSKSQTLCRSRTSGKEPQENITPQRHLQVTGFKTPCKRLSCFYPLSKASSHREQSPKQKAIAQNRNSPQCRMPDRNVFRSLSAKIGHYGALSRSTSPVYGSPASSRSPKGSGLQVGRCNQASPVQSPSGTSPVEQEIENQAVLGKCHSSKIAVAEAVTSQSQKTVLGNQNDKTMKKPLSRTDVEDISIFTCSSSESEIDSDCPLIEIVRKKKKGKATAAALCTAVPGSSVKSSSRGSEHQDRPQLKPKEAKPKRNRKVGKIQEITRSKAGTSAAHVSRQKKKVSRKKKTKKLKNAEKSCSSLKVSKVRSDQVLSSSIVCGNVPTRVKVARASTRKKPPEPVAEVFAGVKTGVQKLSRSLRTSRENIDGRDIKRGNSGRRGQIWTSESPATHSPRKQAKCLSGGEATSLVKCSTTVDLHAVTNGKVLPRTHSAAPQDNARGKDAVLECGEPSTNVEGALTAAAAAGSQSQTCSSVSNAQQSKEMVQKQGAVRRVKPITLSLNAKNGSEENQFLGCSFTSSQQPAVVGIQKQGPLRRIKPITLSKSTSQFSGSFGASDGTRYPFHSMFDVGPIHSPAASLSSGAVPSAGPPSTTALPSSQISVPSDPQVKHFTAQGLSSGLFELSGHGTGERNEEGCLSTVNSHGEGQDETEAAVKALQCLVGVSSASPDNTVSGSTGNLRQSVPHAGGHAVMNSDSCGVMLPHGSGHTVVNSDTDDVTVPQGGVTVNNDTCDVTVPQGGVTVNNDTCDVLIPDLNFSHCAEFFPHPHSPVTQGGVETLATPPFKKNAVAVTLASSPLPAPSGTVVRRIDVVAESRAKETETVCVDTFAVTAFNKNAVSAAPLSSSSAPRATVGGRSKFTSENCIKRANVLFEKKEMSTVASLSSSSAATSLVVGRIEVMAENCIQGPGEQDQPQDRPLQETEVYDVALSPGQTSLLLVNPQPLEGVLVQGNKILLSPVNNALEGRQDAGQVTVANAALSGSHQSTGEGAFPNRGHFYTQASKHQKPENTTCMHQPANNVSSIVGLLSNVHARTLNVCPAKEDGNCGQAVATMDDYAKRVRAKMPYRKLVMKRAQSRKNGKVPSRKPVQVVGMTAPMRDACEQLTMKSYKPILPRPVSVTPLVAFAPVGTTVLHGGGAPAGLRTVSFPSAPSVVNTGVNAASANLALNEGATYAKARNDGFREVGVSFRAPLGQEAGPERPQHQAEGPQEAPCSLPPSQQWLCVTGLAEQAVTPPSDGNSDPLKSAGMQAPVIPSSSNSQVAAANISSTGNTATVGVVVQARTASEISAILRSSAPLRPLLDTPCRPLSADASSRVQAAHTLASIAMIGARERQEDRPGTCDIQNTPHLPPGSSRKRNQSSSAGAVQKKPRFDLEKLRFMDVDKFLSEKVYKK